jgi:hypothetical protein
LLPLFITAALGKGAAFSVVLGASNQFSQLVSSNYGSVAGTLNVTLTNGYVPSIGAQFLIISAPNVGGTFSTLNVPQDICVTYSNNGVCLLATTPAPPQLQSPRVSGGHFSFGFDTVSGQSYIVQQNTNLAATNWTPYTNITGNGSLYQFATPVTNILQRFFRLGVP